MDDLVAEGAAAVITDPRQRIVTAATAVFMERGYSRVTMADIAAELAMSKKTLYQHIASKEELFQAVIDRFFDAIQADLDALLADPSLSFPARIQGFMTVMARHLAMVQPAMMLDVKKASPHLWRHIESRRRAIIGREMAGLFQSGITAGVVRADLDPTIVIQLLLAAIERLATPELIVERGLRPIDIFRMVTTVVFEGIMVRPAANGSPAPDRPARRTP